MKKLLKKHPLLEATNSWLDDEPKWYMLYVKSGELQRVTDDLNKQGVFTYRPKTTIKGDSRRPERVEYVFPKNTFVHLSRKNLHTLPFTREKLSFVYSFDTPVFISDEELEDMHAFLRKYPEVELARDPRLAVGVVQNNFSRNASFAGLQEGPRLFLRSIGCTLVSASFETIKAEVTLLSERKSLASKVNMMLFQLFNRPSARVE